jgi:hypothetical protein
MSKICSDVVCGAVGFHNGSVLRPAIQHPQIPTPPLLKQLSTGHCAAATIISGAA